MYDDIKQSVLEKYSADIEPLLENWLTLIEKYIDSDAQTKLKKVNSFFNRSCLFGNDVDTWEKKDYWATPFELMLYGGDCEDFAIAKFVTLKLMNVEEEKLRLNYATVIVSGCKTSHMVLSYHDDIDVKILDNMVDTVYSIVNRTDLDLLYSFNTESLWVKNIKQDTNPQTAMTMWKDSISRLTSDGILV